MNLYLKAKRRIKREWQSRQTSHRVAELTRQVKEQQTIKINSRPVVFFNASSRLSGLSLNAAYSILSSFAVQLIGVPVIYFVCCRGLSHCVLGTDKDHVRYKPPCEICIRNSKELFSNSDTRWFNYFEDQELKEEISIKNLNELLSFEYKDLPLGEIILPSLRWILRLHHLKDDQSTQYLAREYILSAWSIASEFNKLINEVKPQAIVVFNGKFYPEAIVRHIALKRNLSVFTHEVGMQSFSAFFTSGEATAYPIKVPMGFELSSAQETKLDDYLDKRFQGDFITAGIRFWPKMFKLDEDFWHKAAQYKQFVPVFTNVVFDTSQGHANVLFPHMFAWLDLVLQAIKDHPETYFVIRAHPDELRPGKESRETVAQWIEKNHVDDLPNVLFIHSNEYVSSYELIEHAKFVMVYNSTVGLEASIKGKPVLCAGKARYTQFSTVFFPKDIVAFQNKLNDFLEEPKINIPLEFKSNAYKVFYFLFFMSSLPFSEFLEPDGVWNGFVRIKDFPIQALSTEHSMTMKTIVDGLLHKGPFLLRP